MRKIRLTITRDDVVSWLRRYWPLLIFSVVVMVIGAVLWAYRPEARVRERVSIDAREDVYLYHGADLYVYSDNHSTQKFHVDGATGNTTIAGTLATTGGQTFSGLLNADGGIAVDTSAFTVADGTGNTVVSGTLTVSGTTTLIGALGANGGIAVDTSAFTVADTSGNTGIAGTLDVTGATTLVGALGANGGLAVDTSAFTVADGTGNTVVSGTLTVSGTTTLAGILGANGGLAVDTSAFTVADGTGNTVVSGTLNVTDTATFAGGVDVAGGSLTLANDETISNGTDGFITLGGGLQFASTSITDTQMITPTAYSWYTVNATGMTTITLGTCSVVAQPLFLYADDAQTYEVADVNIYTSDGAKLTFDQYDLVALMCNGAAWVLWYESNVQ